MTIASKTLLLDLSYIQAGSPFAAVTTRSDIDTSGISGYSSKGTPFFGVGNEETITYPSIKNYIRFGAPYEEDTTKSSINASEFDYSNRGAPYWVTFAGAPPTFVASQFFIMF